jgi:translation initiation factor IF-1
MTERTRMEMDGEVIDASKGKFKVRISDTLTVLCTLSGKIRTNSIRILLGDLVRLEVSEYDTTQGRIVHRYK